jgi:hypothetical protein
MTDLAKLQALYADLGLPYQTQGTEQGAAVLTVAPDEHRVLGLAGSQLVYTFEKGKFSNLEILVAAG